MLKVALIAPPYPLDEAPSPPLGLCYAAAAFEAAGAEVIILDYIVRKYTPEKLKSELDLYTPDVVGTNSVTMNFPGAIDILKTVKHHDPSILTMIGGPHVTFDVENTFQHYPEIDIIFIGESEHTILEFVPVINSREAWDSVKGIAFKNYDGDVVITKKREFIQDLDILPTPARHLLPISRYQALGFPVSIITSRGCPNQCIFCQGRRMVGRKVRYRTTELIVDEIENILSYGFTRINIADDFFTSNKKRVRMFCDEILKREISFSWSAFARVDSVDRESLKRMISAGCDTVSFGIESGNPEMLKRVKKRITLDQAREAVKICKDVGMKVFASFMIGLPGETHQTLQDTWDFAEELDIEYGYHFLAPFPGTTLWEEIDQFDLDILTDNWAKYDANRAIVRTTQLSQVDMEKFYNDFDQIVKQKYYDIEKRYKEGTCSDYDRLVIEGYQRMGLIFNLLSKDIIEEHASFTIENSSNDQIETMLLKKISSVMDKEISPQFVDSMRNLINEGYLKYEKNKNRIDWFWTHNNKVDVFSVQT